jgi:hypothetical protein
LNLPARKDECSGVRNLSETRPPSRSRRRRGARGALALVAAGLLAALAAQPAAAEVTLTPGEGVQGDAAELTFGVSEDRAPAHTAKIQVVLDDSNPVAEVYPLSSDDWAPQIAYGTVATPLPGIHGAESTSVVSAITWTRVAPPAGPVTPTSVNQLRVSLGPLPQTDNLRFLVVQTYSDGIVKRWTNTALTLTPPAGLPTQPGQQAPGGHVQPGHPDAAAGAAPAEGGNVGVVVGVVVALVIGVAIGGAVVASSRMRPGGDDGPDGGPDGGTDGDGPPDGDAAATGEDAAAPGEPDEVGSPRPAP